MKGTGLILLAGLALIFPACGDDGDGGPECNNGKLETGELCDGTELGGETCEGLGYFTGTLGCTDQCIFNESGCTNCGNGTKDEGEMCDGQDLDQKNCIDLGYDGGDLACNADCTFNGNDCYACGNNVIEEDEECDRERFGTKTCKTEGHDGGDLICTNNCVIDESQCYDCGGVDPCEAQICSGHGRCRVANCVPYCECDNGFIPGVGLTCLEEGTCGEVGEDCTQNEDCCLGACILGYCTGPCETDSDCINNGADGRDMCCVWGDPANWCQKTAAAGVSCGDHSGTCGTSCAGALSSACADGNICMGWAEDDPNAVCGSRCTADAECDLCGTPGTYECLLIGTGESFCYPIADPCDSTDDCTDPQICGIALNDSQDGYEGVCRDLGDAATGSVCDWDPHPWDERCASGLCLGVDDSGHCSEWCLDDGDCPVDMLCSMISLCQDSTCTDVYTAPLCWWMPGSQTDCVSTADCPVHEICALNFLPPDGLLANKCISEECDPVSPDCGDVGDVCGDGQPTCAGRLCVNNGVDEWCSALCDADAQCPPDMYCAPMPVDEQTQGVCAPGTPCTSTADCPAGEVCNPVLGLQNDLRGVCWDNGPDPAGTDCDPAASTCKGWCVGGKCSEVCAADADCGAGGTCAFITFCFDQDCNDQASAPVCIWLEGSQDPCTTNADCTAETCMPVQMVAGTQTVCITPLPTDPLCSMCAADADCGGDSVCIISTSNPGERYCGLPCPVGDECPGGYTCTDAGGTVDNCMPLDDSCMTD